MNQDQIQLLGLTGHYGDTISQILNGGNSTGQIKARKIFSEGL